MANQPLKYANSRTCREGTKKGEKREESMFRKAKQLDTIKCTEKCKE